MGQDRTGKDIEERNFSIKVLAFLEIPLCDQIPGYNGAVYLPKNPQAWADDMTKSIEETGQCKLHIDSLAGGTGGCSFTFTSDDEHGPGFDLGGTKGFGFVLSREGLLALKRAIDYVVNEED